jgi:hypothetical protein
MTGPEVSVCLRPATAAAAGADRAEIPPAPLLLLPAATL